MLQISEKDEIRFVTMMNEVIFVSRTHIKENDFKGRIVEDTVNWIRTQSILMIETQGGLITEIIPFGDFDINNTFVTSNYIYFEKISDKDCDGLLLDNDYCNGEMWRVNRNTLIQEFCFKMFPYKMHRLLSANDEFIIFISEDRIPDVSEVVFFNMFTKQFAILNNIYEKDWCDFRMVNTNQGEPDYFLFTQEVEMDSIEVFPEIKMIRWSDLIPQLLWE